MATFIKAGFWEKLCKPCKGYKGWLNLDDFVESRIPAPTPPLYKVYTALLTQASNFAPFATVLENTLGGTVIWSYDGIGLYSATLNGAFLLNKTTSTINVTNGNALLYIGRSSDDQMVLISRNFLDVPIDDSINDCTLEIRVYN